MNIFVKILIIISIINKDLWHLRDLFQNYRIVIFRERTSRAGALTFGRKLLGTFVRRQKMLG